jgi:hypothetical protein
MRSLARMLLRSLARMLMRLLSELLMNMDKWRSNIRVHWRSHEHTRGHSLGRKHRVLRINESNLHPTRERMHLRRHLIARLRVELDICAIRLGLVV